jgi:hypothetical protein
MIDISKLSPRQLFELHSWIEDELREQKIIRTANKPTGDLAEYLFRTAFDWEPASNSQAHYDAKGKTDGLLYQIKGRRITRFNSSRQLSAIRDLEGAQHFNVLAGVLFNEDYSVKRAALIPHAVLLNLVKKRSHISFQEHTNSHVFLLVDELWNEKWKAEGVRNVTTQLKSVWH